MIYAICTVPAAPVRKEAAHRSEMVNQLLFGESMEILESKDEWFRVRSIYDDYEGWLTYHLVAVLPEGSSLPEQDFMMMGLLNPVMASGQILNAPMGSTLPGFDETTKNLWDERYQYFGSYKELSSPLAADQILNIAFAWINAPYLWGGKTFMGVDCSGFSQTVFKAGGIRLKRDAWQQAMQGSLVDDLSLARPGDLGFFCNQQGKVTHVGILVHETEIIHSSGKVRLDTLDKNGIINRETGKRTHDLYSVRRYF